MSAFPYSATKKSKVERKRQNDCKQAIYGMKETLLQKGYGTEKELSSQEDVLFRVIDVLTGVNLSPQFSLRIVKEASDSTMTLDEMKDLRKRRETYRRQKYDTALEKLREFVMEHELGSVQQRSRLERLATLNLIWDHIKTLPDSPNQPANPIANFSLMESMIAAIFTANPLANPSEIITQIVNLLQVFTPQDIPETVEVPSSNENDQGLSTIPDPNSLIEDVALPLTIQPNLGSTMELLLSLPALLGSALMTPAPSPQISIKSTDSGTQKMVKNEEAEE